MVELYTIPAGIPEDLDRNRPVVIIDIFRASTSITAALAAGAREIHVAGSMEEAETLKMRLGKDVVMAGEREGFRIDGYDLGNSPYEMTPDNVAGRPVVFNSTNGTKLMRRFQDFKHIIIGSLVSLSATVDYLGRFHGDPILACAGRLDLFSGEDALAAGLIISRLAVTEDQMDDAARFAKCLVELSGDKWRRWARESFHGRYLTSIGLAADLDFCLTVDKYSFVPIKKGEILVRSDRP
jgi:2-phosphosulfolactate phosphatase